MRWQKFTAVELDFQTEHWQGLSPAMGGMAGCQSYKALTDRAALLVTPTSGRPQRYVFIPLGMFHVYGEVVILEGATRE